MALDKAWETLGLSLESVKATLRKVPATQRGEVAERALAKARKAAKKMMANAHPDKCPGDANAPHIFRNAHDALASIEHHTIEFQRKLLEYKPVRVGFIEFFGPK